MHLLYYPLLVAGLGVLLLSVWDSHTARRVAWILVRLFVVAFLILLIGAFLELWQLPPPFAQLYLWLSRLLEPLGRPFVEWIRRWLP